MFPEFYFGITYKLNYRKINLILKPSWDYFLFCVFGWYAVFTDLEKETWEIQPTMTKKNPQKQGNTTKRKSRSIIKNYNGYYIQQEKDKFHWCKIQAGKKNC